MRLRTVGFAFLSAVIASVSPVSETLAVVESPQVEHQVHSPITRKPGWPISLPNQFARSPGLAEVGDPRGLAIIFHDTDGLVHALAPDAQPIWNRRVRITSFNVATVPAIADLDSDGRQEVVLGVGDLHAFSEAGTSLSGWPPSPPEGEIFLSYTPVIARFTPDGPLRIVVASAASPPAGSIHVLDKDGQATPGWPVVMSRTDRVPLVSIAVGDVTGNGVAEVVVMDSHNRRLLVYDYQGQLLAPFPISTGQIQSWDAPTLGDLDGDGAAEIVFRRYSTIMVLRGDGTPLPGWPQETESYGFGGLALGDVDGDGDLEVACATRSFSYYSPRGGVYLWNGDGTLLPGWPKLWSQASFTGPTIIADVNGDGQGDVIASSSSLGTQAKDAIYAWNSSGELIRGFPINFFGQLTYSTPLVADIDRDGITDLGIMVQLGGWPTYRAFMWWFDLGVPYRPEGMQWPMEGHDRGRTGAYSPPVLPAGLRSARVELNPNILQTSTPAAPLVAVITLPADSTLVPNVLRLVEVDGTPVSGMAAYRRGGLNNGSDVAGNEAVVFQFDRRAVVDLLGSPGVYRLLFNSDILGDQGGIMYEAEADLTLR